VKISQLRLENFGPFYGRHTLDFTVSDAARVILIHGENERGKTTIANAIRWCLYKKAMGRNKIEIPTSRLLNGDAKEGGQFNLSVQIDFEHAGARFELERHVQASKLPLEDRDFAFRCALKRNGSFVNEATVERSIKEILHPQISRFFLFDGEMLNEYEDLLRDQYRRVDVVKQSIEQILGLPSIQTAVVSLLDLKRNVERAQLQEARARRDNEKLIAQAQQREEEVNALEKDILRQEEIKANLEAERNALRQQLETFGEVRADLKELDRLEKAVNHADERVEEIRGEVQMLLRESWWIPLEQAASNCSQGAQHLAERAAVTSAARDQVAKQLGDIAKAIESGVCALCGHKLDAAELTQLELKRDLAHDELGRIEPTDSPAKYFETMTFLRPFIGQAAHQTLREKEAELRRLGIRKRQDTLEIEQIRERVKTDYRSEVGQIERNLEKCLGQMRDAERTLSDSMERQTEADASLQRLQREIRQLPSANRGLAVQAAIFESLREVFSGAIDEFRERLRKEVEREATDIHQSLTADPGYGGLRINEQFGLSLLNDRGRVVPDRSAGSEQIVALSLIGALNRCATREAPVVMDTPFGRLDRRHRANILRFAPKFGAQVILLVQSGELERDRDLGDLKTSIAREYRIERDGASDRSRIVEISS
jgi:DNA sulfur modification protein DndD